MLFGEFIIGSAQPKPKQKRRVKSLKNEQLYDNESEMRCSDVISKSMLLLLPMAPARHHGFELDVDVTTFETKQKR